MNHPLPEQKQIRNLIFDLGGVILNIDYNLTSAAFKKLGLHDFDTIYSKARQSDLFDNLEKGKITREGFAHRIREMGQGQWSNASVETAWNAMLLDLPVARLSLLADLAKQYRLFLLSNTNEIHLEGCRMIFREITGYDNLAHIFEKEYYSNLIGMRKPDREVFDHIVDEQGLKREETLFIDDSIQHVEGAARAGLHAFHLTDGNTITDVFGGWVWSAAG
ncbi:MAG: HAD family phosphatase [Flavobacteriales bacterium]|nr:HAD family phosphatase [Flavobacteriales bacterium]MCB9449495.1 HAD family phosphatase [Flavobacteriales bacterium]